MGQGSISEFFQRAPPGGNALDTGPRNADPVRTDDSDDECPGKFVDLFAGIGGASTGAINAGYSVTLAVDNWDLAMEAHEINHPRTRHLCMQLPPPPGEELPLPAAGEKWHLHGSPPCTLLSEANHRTRTAEEFADGLAMVRWYLDYALASSATTWSMEQVNQQEVRKLLRSYRLPGAPHRTRLDWDVFDTVDLGVPQTRRRIIAGSPHLIARLRRARRPKRRVPVTAVLSEPRGTMIRNETLYQGKKDDPNRRRMGKEDMCRSIRKPCFCVVAYKPLRWVTPNTDTPMIRLSTYESGRIQGFPEGYVYPDGVVNGIRSVGNAVPPPVMTQLLRPPRARPLSPSLEWRRPRGAEAPPSGRVQGR
jgi:DNA (cytosine-5)-methyltransferase 1